MPLDLDASADGLLNVLQTAGVSVEGSRAVASGGGAVLPLTRFSTEADVERLENTVYDRLLAPGSPAPDLTALVSGHFAELAANAVQHARSPIGAVGSVAAGAIGGETQIAIVVADAGIGIAPSLRQDPLHLDAAANDWIALVHATRELVSGTGDPSRGLGLYEAAAIAMSPGIALTIHSGAGMLHISGQAGLSAHKSAPFPGTLVQMSFDV